MAYYIGLYVHIYTGGESDVEVHPGAQPAEPRQQEGDTAGCRTEGRVQDG